MGVVEQPQVGVNGRILPVSSHGRDGYVFEAPDGTRGPVRAVVGLDGGVRAFAQARADWRDWLKRRKPAVAGA